MLYEKALELLSAAVGILFRSRSSHRRSLSHGSDPFSHRTFDPCFLSMRQNALTEVSFMKIVVFSSPKFLAPFLRLFFKIEK